MPTIEELAARLDQLEARMPTPRAAVPPVTIGELTDVPTPGSPIASAWAQEVTRRAVHRFATKAALDAGWPAATAGNAALAITTDRNRLYMSDGTVWVLVDNGSVAGRTGCEYTSATLGVLTGAVTAISLNGRTRDVDGWYAGTLPTPSVTVPVGQDAQYMIGISTRWSSNTLGLTPTVSVVINGTAVAATNGNTSNGLQTVGHIANLVSGNTVAGSVFQTSGVSVTADSSFTVARMGR